MRRRPVLAGGTLSGIGLLAGEEEEDHPDIYQVTFPTGDELGIVIDPEGLFSSSAKKAAKVFAITSPIPGISDKIPDPFYGTNEKDLYWVSEKDWEYTKTFKLSKDILSSEMALRFTDMRYTI